MSLYYDEVRSFVLGSQVLHARIGTLINKLANRVGFVTKKARCCWTITGQKGNISLPEKL